MRINDTEIFKLSIVLIEQLLSKFSWQRINYRTVVEGN